MLEEKYQNPVVIEMRRVFNRIAILRLLRLGNVVGGVGGGGLVGGGGSGLVGGRGGGDVGLCLGVHGLSLVLDIGNISVRASTVGNNLYSAIRKVHSVLTSGVVVGPLLLLGENGTVMRIVDSILVLK